MPPTRSTPAPSSNVNHPYASVSANQPRQNSNGLTSDDDASLPAAAGDKENTPLPFHNTEQYYKLYCDGHRLTIDIDAFHQLNVHWSEDAQYFYSSIRNNSNPYASIVLRSTAQNRAVLIDLGRGYNIEHCKIEGWATRVTVLEEDGVAEAGIWQTDAVRSRKGRERGVPDVEVIPKYAPAGCGETIISNPRNVRQAAASSETHQATSAGRSMLPATMAQSIAVGSRLGSFSPWVQNMMPASVNTRTQEYHTMQDPHLPMVSPPVVSQDSSTYSRPYQQYQPTGSSSIPMAYPLSFSGGETASTYSAAQQQ